MKTAERKKKYNNFLEIETHLSAKAKHFQWAINRLARILHRFVQFFFSFLIVTHRKMFIRIRTKKTSIFDFKMTLGSHFGSPAKAIISSDPNGM